jgi:hypothetical protein
MPDNLQRRSILGEGRPIDAGVGTALLTSGLRAQSMTLAVIDCVPIEGVVATVVRQPREGIDTHKILFYERNRKKM